MQNQRMKYETRKKEEGKTDPPKSDLSFHLGPLQKCFFDETLEKTVKDIMST